MTAREPWCDARDAIRAALGLGRATAIARAIENEPPAHMLAADVAAAKAPFDAALQELDALLDIADAAHNAVVVNGWDEPRESVVVTNPELKRLADTVLAFPSRAAGSQPVPRP